MAAAVGGDFKAREREREREISVLMSQRMPFWRRLDSVYRRR